MRTALPNVEMTGLPLTRAVAAHGLRGATHEWPARPLEPVAWRGLLGAVRRERVTGLLVDAIGSGALPTTPAQLEEATQSHLASMVTSLRLDQRLLVASAALDNAGVTYRVLKGPAIAHLSYPDPALRSYGDVDLLVPSAVFGEALKVLGDCGYRRSWPQLRPGFDRRFGKGAPLRSEEGWELDLHRTFVMGPFGLTVDLDGLFASQSAFRLGDRTLPALGAEERLLHACYVAALSDDPPRLVALRDVAQHALEHPIDHRRVIELAVAWRGQAVLARGVGLTWTHLALADRVALSVWAARYQPTPRDRRALAVYRRRTPYTLKALASLRVIEGTGAKLAFARALALPDRDWLQARGLGRTGWLRRGGAAIVDPKGRA